MKQVRFIPIADCELQVREPLEGQSESRRVEGKPIIFGVRSNNLTPWSRTRKVYEILEPGCITNDLLLRSDVIMNINHSNKVTDVLGRCRDGKGTLELGLREGYVEAGCDFPRTNAANDTLELIRRGDISGMSFAFDDDDEDTENGVSLERTMEVEDGKEVWLRHVKRIDGLYDVSIVTHPAYEQTSVAVREMSEAIDKQIELQLQREAANQGEPADGKTNDEQETREAKAREEQERKEQEERELEEQAERARQTRELRRRMQRMRLNCKY